MPASNPSSSSRRLRYLHRIGYVTTAIVATQLLFVTSMVVAEWWERRQIDAARHENTRTHLGTLADQQPSRAWATGLLKTLPKSADVSDSIQIVVAPSLSSSSYAIGLMPAAAPKDPVAVSFVIADADPCDVRVPLNIKRRAFVIEASEYRTFAEWFDEATKDYAGSNEVIVDGTSVAFERRQAGQITSGAGNNGIYEALATRLLALLKPYLTSAEIPADGDWYSPSTNTDCPA